MGRLNVCLAVEILAALTVVDLHDWVKFNCDRYEIDLVPEQPVLFTIGNTLLVKLAALLGFIGDTFFIVFFYSSLCVLLCVRYIDSTR